MILAFSTLPAPAAGPASTPEQVYADVLRQSIGAPARAELGSVASVRLDHGLLFVPHDPAIRLLAVDGRTPPPDFLGLLLGAPGMDAMGFVRFVPSGLIDSNAALQWTADDMFDSLGETVEHANPQRVADGLPERELRRWVRPPHYDPDAHTLSWAALIVPKSAPRESDGETVFHGLAFGRDGYVELTIPTSVELATDVGGMVDTFLLGVGFPPGKTYPAAGDAAQQPKPGLAAAMGIDTLRKAREHGSFWSSDRLVPTVGAAVAGIGAISLFFYIQRHLRRLARRV